MSSATPFPARGERVVQLDVVRARNAERVADALVRQRPRHDLSARELHDAKMRPHEALFNWNPSSLKVHGDLFPP